MSNKKKEQLEKEQKDEMMKAELQKRYEEYKERISRRIELDEKVEIVPYEKWVRKLKKTNSNGILTEVEVAGISGETKNEIFRRLAISRMEKALKDLDLIMSLSSIQYQSTEEEQARIITALRLKVIDIENSFKSREKKTESFTF